MSARELAEWAAYYAVEPWGEDRADYRAGIVAATVANVMSARRGKPMTPRDFMPEFGPRKVQSAAEIKAQLMRVVVVPSGKGRTNG